MRSLGRFGSPWTVDQARRQAIVALGKIVEGTDPFANATPKVPQVADVAKVGDDFSGAVEVYLARKAGVLAPNTLRLLRLYLRTSFAALNAKPLALILRRDVAACLAEIEKASGSVTRNRARAALSTFFAWAIAEGIVEQNPVAGTGKADEASRERVLADGELAAIWRALPSGIYGDVVKLLALTGQRRIEIGGLYWSEVDFDARVLRLPGDRTKNGRPHVIPLSDPALAILQSRREFEGAGSGVARNLGPGSRVFGDGRNGYNGWSDGKAGLDARLSLAQPWTLHDLRRTCATGMAELGVAPHIIEAVLNHVSGHKAGVAGIYNRGKYEPEKRTALALWAGHVLSVIA
jgi:integrase